MTLTTFSEQEWLGRIRAQIKVLEAQLEFATLTHDDVVKLRTSTAALDHEVFKGFALLHTLWVASHPVTIRQQTQSTTDLLSSL